MKKTFKLAALLLAIVALITTGCKKDKKDAAFSISRVNLTGVKYLALGSQNSGAKGDAKGGVQNMLYSIDENGDMQLVAYEYDCDEDGLETELSRNIGIMINQIVPVGDKYIWLVGCRYVCDDYSGFSESMQNRIRGVVQHSLDSWFGDNFLIRKSDGKIFDLGEVIGKFPVGNVGELVPGFGNVGMVFNGDMPLDGEISADRLSKLGLINQVGDEVYLASGSWQGGLAKLKDNGSQIDVINVYPANIAYSITDGQGHLGTVISYSSNIPQIPAIMAPDGTLPSIQGIPTAGTESSCWPEMRCIGGKFFVSVNVNDWNGDDYDSIYRVDASTSPATAIGVAKGYFSDDEYEAYSTITYVSDDETYSWFSGTSLFTFNSSTYQLTENSLPAGWPQYSLYDAEGCCYEAHLGNGLQGFTIYRLATLTTENVACDRSQVPTYNIHKGCSYDGGIKAFVESVIMADGSTVTIVTPVTGADKGVSRIQSQTEANNNVVVSTLVPLN